jgi:glucose-6-phosphate isomerase
MNPFSVKLDFETGEIHPYTEKAVRTFEDMSDFYLKSTEKNPVIYEVYARQTPPEEGQLSFATTILYPGKIGREYFMTKGHFHEKENRSEVYLGVSGKGLILMENKSGESKYLDLGPGEIVYVPPKWAHRSINTGKEKFVFIAIYPSDAGHEYEQIREKGFSLVVLEEEGHPVVKARK